MRVHDVAEQLKISTSTVRKYVREGKIHCTRNAAGQRYFTQKDIDDFLGIETNTKTAFYIRSSSGNKRLMDAQNKELTAAYGEPDKTYKDYASGLKEDRPGLKRLIRDAEQGKITHVYATYPDRISRFGVSYIEHILTTAGCKITYLHPEVKYSLEEELMSDFMALIASFTGRFYHIRGIKQKHQLLEAARKRIDEGHSVEEREANKLG